MVSNRRHPPAATAAALTGDREARPNRLAIARGYAVLFGPGLLIDGLVAASTIVVLRRGVAHWRTGHAQPLHPLAVLGAAAPWLHLLALRPRMAHWGATTEEVQLPLPGDEVGAHPAFVSTRAITIDAPIEVIWPWLAQVGQDRGSYDRFDWLEGPAGVAIRDAERAHPARAQRTVSEPDHMTPFSDPTTVALDPGRAIVLENGRTFALRPLDAHRTRVILRSRRPGWRALSAALLMEIPHFVMDLGMLIGLKRRVERSAHKSELLDRVLPRYEFQGTVSTRIRASREQIFRALWEVTLADMPLAYALGTLRYLPARLSGRLQQPSDEASRPFFELLHPLVLAEEPGRELVIGSAGKLHNLMDQQQVPLASPEAFMHFNTPGYEKLVESIRIVGGDERTGYTIIGEHRTHAIGPSARWKFALYWYLMVGWAGSFLFKLLLDAVKRRAERDAAQPRASTGRMPAPPA